MTLTEIKHREFQGKPLVIACDESGYIYLNDTQLTQALTGNGVPVGAVGFVWAGSAAGLPANTKIGFTAAEMQTIAAACADYTRANVEADAAWKAEREAEREFDMKHNDGHREGYNPHRPR